MIWQGDRHDNCDLLRWLCLTNLFCWSSLVCYSLYFTGMTIVKQFSSKSKSNQIKWSSPDFVGQAVFEGNPTALPGSEVSSWSTIHCDRVWPVLLCASYVIFPYLKRTSFPLCKCSFLKGRRKYDEGVKFACWGMAGWVNDHNYNGEWKIMVVWKWLGERIEW